MFGTGFVDDKTRQTMLAPFAEMGRTFAQTGRFDKAAVDAFAAPEFMPKSQIRMFNLIGKPISRIFMGRIAKQLGCKDKLDARPYEQG